MGSENTFNAVVFPHIQLTRFYAVPDVNKPNRDYHFEDMSFADWDWNLSPGLANNPIQPSDGYIRDLGARETGFPLHALTSSSWRAVMIEEDNDVRHFATPFDGDWEGDVATYDFSSGSVSDVYTEIDADWSGYRYDEVFTNSGYRRATLTNAQNRISAGSTTRTNADGFQYTFEIRNITS